MHRKKGTSIGWYLKNMLPLLLLIGVTVLVSTCAYRSLMRTEQEKCWQNLEDAAETVNREIVIRMEDNFNFLRLAADSLAEDAAETQAFARQVETVRQLTAFDRIDVIYPDNSILLRDGSVMSLSEGLTFETLAEQGEHVSLRKVDPVSGKNCFYCIVPVEKKGETVALLAAMVDCDAMKNYFQPDIYNKQAYSCIVDSRDGSFILDPWHETLGNAYEMTDRKRPKEYENADPAGEIHNLSTGVNAFYSETQGVLLYLYYTPVGVYDWELLLFVPEEAAFQGMFQMRRALLVVGGVGFLLLAIYFAWNISSMRRLIESQRETAKQLEISQTLIQCVTELSAKQETEQSIQNLLSIIGRYYHGDRSYIFELDQSRNEIRNTYEYVSETSTSQKEKSQHISMEAIRPWFDVVCAQGLVYVEDTEKTQDQYGPQVQQMLEGRGLKSLIAMPLMREGETVGFLGIDNPKERCEDLQLLRSLRFFVNSSLEAQARQEALRNLSYTDRLTGLYNRNRYMYLLEKYGKQPLSQVGTAYIDLNEMKRVNDEQGHEAGDRLLQKTAEQLMAVFPGKAYRIGGDEFVVLVADVPKALFENHLDELRHLAVQNGLNLSCGAVWAEHCENLERQLEEADRRMYQEKEAYYSTRPERLRRPK